MSGSQFQQRARDIANRAIEVSNDFERWLHDHPASVTGEVSNIIGAVSSLRRRARIISRACERPASIAIYGESQVGKSYLVSTLAKGPNPRSRVKFSSNDYDFLTEINPQGDKESTGLVTRLSIKPPPSSTSQHPVYLELLSELDIVKIFVNAYYGDITHKDTQSLSEEAVDQALQRARSYKRPAATHHIDSDDVNDLKEYMARDVFSFDKLKVLNSEFWTELQTLVPHLPTIERVHLYSLLWLNEKPLTRAAQVLIEALDSLGHAEGVNVGIEAIVPRERSIIDVEQLRGFETAGGETLEVETVGGSRAAIPRATLCALTAEVYMQLSSPAGGALDTCDLLDFPGARAREKNESLEVAISKPRNNNENGWAELYKRGKVDVLFKRYTANYELAALLLCRRSGNQSAYDINTTVYNWIEATLGDSPSKRQSKNTLFVLFTRFDEIIAPKEAGGSAESTLENPIKNAFVEFFNQNLSDNWPSNWDGENVFKNCHWYRNPFAAISPLFSYEGKVEKGINPEQASRIAEFRQTFIETDHLNRYFYDPTKAWDSVMGILDGGVSHIKERLAVSVDPAIKFEQLAHRISEGASNLRHRMDAFCVSDDNEAERRKRIERATETLRAVQQNVMAYQQFGFMIEGLQISPDSIRSEMRKALSEQHVDDEEQGLPGRGVYEIKTDVFDMGIDQTGSPMMISPHGKVAADATQAPDICDAVADIVLRQWACHLKDRAANVNWRRRLRLGEEELTTLTDELIRIAEHQGVRTHLTNQVKAWRQRSGKSMRQGFEVLLRQMTDTINTFTFYLGYDDVPSNERPYLDRMGRRLFDRPNEAHDEFQVTDRRGAFNQQLYDSWIRAVLLRTSAAADKGRDFDRVANEKLKTLIASMDEVTA